MNALTNKVTEGSMRSNSPKPVMNFTVSCVCKDQSAELKTAKTFFIAAIVKHDFKIETQSDSQLNY